MSPSNRERIARCLGRILTAGLLILLFSDWSSAQEAETKEFTQPLYAVSLQRVLRQVKGDHSEAAYNLGWLTTPVALFVDDRGDIIIVGKAEPEDMHLTVDDFALGYRNRDLGDPSQSPSVSIDPPGRQQSASQWESIWRRSDRWSVTYGGREFEETRMALAYFKADMLLKWLSFGYEPTGVAGFPSEWDIFSHQNKLGREVDPWTVEATPMYFYPLNIGVAPASRGARIDLMESGQGQAVDDLRIAVVRPKRGRFHSLLLQEGIEPSVVAKLMDIGMEEAIAADWKTLEAEISRVIGDDKQARKVVKLTARMREHFYRGGGDLERSTQGAAPDYLFDELDPQAAFARLLTDNYETFSRRYSVLRLYESFVRLQVLCSYTLRHEVDEGLHEQLMQHRLQHVETPKSIPAIMRRSVGPFGVSFRGGIYPVVADTIEEAVWGGAEALQKLVLNFRPEDESRFIWLVPLSKQEVESAQEVDLNELLEQLHPIREVDMDEGLSFELRKVTSGEWWGADSPPELPLPKRPERWEPSTHGGQVFDFRGRTVFGTGSVIPLRIDQLYVAPPQEIVGQGYDVTATWTYEDKLQLRAQWPLVVKMIQVPKEFEGGWGGSTTLPGLYSYKLAGGLQNLTLHADYFDRRFSLDSPRIDAWLHMSYVSPLRLELIGGEAASVTYSIDGWNAYFGPIGIWHATDGFQLAAAAFAGSNNYVAASRRIRDKEFVFIVSPSVSPRKRWIDTLSLNLQYISGNEGRVGVELSTMQFIRGEQTRAVGGIAQAGNGDWFYYYRFTFPIHTLEFTKRLWFR